ncbi:MAG: glycosyl transferase, family 2 [Marmoricola sp.]|nr:glycosyl transferase, family 2 [Marmoricola sp.]
MRVTALLVSHNGARWLPKVLAGLEASTALPQDIIAIDTGSGDDSVKIVEQALGKVHRLDAGTSYAAAVRAGLELAGPAEPDEWIWLLHDDSSPDPTCFAVLREEAENAEPEVAVLGPKLREWPSLKRLLELGVTITGTGRRETGLERGEYDQGQHDDVRDVLAVNTAGMLVRRSVLERIGFDELLPIFGNDIDFGWRAANAGHRTRIIPQALMFHAEAAHRGLRQSRLVSRPRRDERAAAIYTLLVNQPARSMPYRIVRLFFGGMLRAFGFLLVRALGEARDEVAAIVRVYLRPDRIIAGRRARRGTQTVPKSQVKPLLAPIWLPYRHGLDVVIDLASAVADSSRDAAARRTNGTRATAGATLDDDEDLPEDTGLLARLFRSPRAWTFLLVVVLALVAGRDSLHGGPLHGGALLPAPPSVGHWWSTYFSSTHLLGTGTDATAPAYLLPLAVFGTILLGKASWLITLLFVLAVPLTMWSALRFLRKVVDNPWAQLWGALAYALVPVLSGSVGQGRLGTVAGALVLPWVARSALGLNTGDMDRRWRAAWRTAIGVAVLSAFAPTAGLLTLVLVGIAIIALPAMRIRSGFQPLLVVALVPLLLLLPWLAGTLMHPAAWFIEAGRPGAVPVNPTIWQLVLGRGSGPGSAPGWLSIGLPVIGVAALIRPDSRSRVVKVWLVIAVAAVLLACVSLMTVSLPGVSSDFRPWPGFLLVLIQGGFILAAVIASDGVGKLLSTASFSWRQPVGVVAFVAALVAPVLGAGWWVAHGTDDLVNRHSVSDVPAYMTELATGRNTGAVLVLTGGARHGIEYHVLRDGPLRIGDDAIRALTRPDPKVTALVERLLSSARPDDAARLASYGVAYVYAPAPVSGSVSAGLDASNGFAGASAPDPNTRAWRLDAPPTLASVDQSGNPVRGVLLAIQVLAILACIVLAAPGRKLS